MNTDFSIIETVLWEKNSFFLLDEHLSRMAKSAGYFSFICDINMISSRLKSLEKDLPPFEAYRVRILMNKSGGITITPEKLERIPEYPVKIGFSPKRIDKNDIFLYHKTTNRALYETELKRSRAKGFFDVIFMNKAGEITEGAITNIMIEKGGKYLTPPVICGLLPGVYRQYLLTAKLFPLEEKTLYKEDLLAADRIILINSVRKTIPVILAEPTHIKS